MQARPTSQKPKFTVLASGLGWHVEDLQRAAIKVGVELEPVLFQNLSIELKPSSGTLQPFSKTTSELIRAGAHLLNEQDAILVRMMPPSGLERVVFRMDVLHRLQESGVPVINPPRTIEMAVDKALSLARIGGAGIAVPETWIGESPDDALIAFDRLGGDVVCKPIFGSEGRGLIRLQNREMAWRVVHGLNQTGSVIYLQKFIDNDGFDLRIMILNGEVLAAMRRTAPANDFRTNVAQGAKAEILTNVPHEVSEIAIQVSRITSGLILGVDLMQSRVDARWHVLEVNAVPGWRALSAVSGVDIAAEWLWAVHRGLK